MLDEALKNGNENMEKLIENIIRILSCRGVI